MNDESLPPLRCESRRPSPPDGGWLKWALALVVLGASTLDAMWLIPAQRAAEDNARAIDLRAWKCADLAPAAPPAPPPPPHRAHRANDILLLAPRR